MKNFRLIARLEIKDNFLIKGIRMEGLKKLVLQNFFLKNIITVVQMKYFTMMLSLLFIQEK